MFTHLFFFKFFFRSGCSMVPRRVLCAAAVIGWPRPTAAWSGVWVPSQRWRLVAAVKAPVPRPVVSDEGPGHSALQRRISTETESREASQVCIRRKESTIRVDRRRGVPEPRPRGGLSPFPGALLPGFLWPVILVRLVPSPRLVHLGILPPVRTHLSAKNG